MDLTAAARPLRLTGTPDLAILLIHGFTSTPACMAGWAEGLHRATGATVEAPLLPGHGTRWEDLNTVVWQDWEKTVLEAFDGLAATHRRVAVGGLSLGGCLATLVAARRPQTAALVLVNHLMWLGNPVLPLAPLIKRLTPSMPSIGGDIKKPGTVEPAYDRVPTGGVDQFRRLMKVVRPLLPSVTMPTLLFKSRVDHVIPAASTLKTIARLGAARKDLVWLEDSWHVATMDNDLPLLVDRTAAFLKETV